MSPRLRWFKHNQRPARDTPPASREDRRPGPRSWHLVVSVLDMRKPMDRPPRLEQCQMRHLRGDRPGIMRASGNPGHGITTRGRSHPCDNNDPTGPRPGFG